MTDHALLPVLNATAVTTAAIDQTKATAKLAGQENSNVRLESASPKTENATDMLTAGMEAMKQIAVSEL